MSDCIDGEELANACRRLGISGPLEPLLRELKRESPQPHQHHHQHQQQQQHNQKQPSLLQQPQQYSCASGGGTGRDSGSNRRHHTPTKSDRKFGRNNNNKEKEISVIDEKGGKSSTYGQESWGRDSGARDLSPEPHRVGTSCAGTDGQLTDNETGTTSSMIHLANKLQVAALSALKTEVLELSARLQNAEREREVMQRKLNEAVEDKERSHRRLDSINSSHESRLTEMHCIIVELSKKLRNREENAIMEENEPEGSVSELSFQEGSVYNSEMECTNLEQESQTEPLDTKLVQPIHNRSDSPNSLPPPSSSAHLQLQAMHEEVFHLRGQVALLQSQLASDRDKFDEDQQNKQSTQECDQTLNSPRDRSNYTSDDLCETAELFDNVGGGQHHQNIIDDVIRRPQTTNKLCATQSSKLNRNALALPRGSSPVIQYGSINSLNKQQNSSLITEMPSPKLSDKSRIHNHHAHHRRTPDDYHNNSASASATPDPIMTSGIFASDMSTHLVSDYLQQDFDISAESPHIQNELQRLQRRIDHLRIQNTVLTLSLAESKSHCNHLYLLCGKYESNAIALQQALGCSDRAIEAYDVMLALLESRLGILEDTPSAIDSRKAAEAVAKHLMSRLNCDENLHSQSLGPWQDAVVIYANSSANTQPWTPDDDDRLRDHVSKLKGQRASIQNTVVNLESPFCDDSIDGSMPVSDAKKLENRRMDLETAVLLQELMSTREEMSELKYRTDHAEREKNNTIQRLTVMQEALLHLQAQLADSEALLAMNSRDRSSYSEAEHTAGIERELVEALARESRLKARLQGLASSLGAAAKSSEEKYAQVQNTVSELKQTNVALTHSLDRCKRKYQSRLRRLEQQVAELSTRKTNSNANNISGNNTVQSPMKPVPETTL